MPNFKNVFRREVKATCSHCLASERYFEKTDKEINKDLEAKGWIQPRKDVSLCGGCAETYKHRPEAFMNKYFPE